MTRLVWTETLTYLVNGAKYWLFTPRELEFFDLWMSDKSVDEICKEMKITERRYYGLLKQVKSVVKDTYDDISEIYLGGNKHDQYDYESRGSTGEFFEERRGERS